jgi:DNA polymerase-3 subunit alpha
VIDAERPRFIEGAKAKGLTEAQAGELFDLILKFAGYGFNKSHSTGYAIIAYQTAYLKTYFPNQYMAALLTYESQARKVEEWVQYLERCRETPFPDHTPESPHVGIEVLAPDLNLSEAEFSVVFADGEPRDALHGHVRFGLGAIRGSGKATVEKIIEERRQNGPFTSLYDFCERLAGRVNRATVEALVKSGCLDSLHGQSARSSMMAAIEDALAAGQALADDRAAGQMNMFQAVGAEIPVAEETARRLPSVPAWDRMTTLAYEKEALGFHVSGHPLDQYAAVLDAYANSSTTDVLDRTQDARVVLGGVLSRVRITMARSGRNAGQKMAMITLQDKRGVVDGVVFSGVFARCAHLLQTDALVLIVARVDRSRGEPQLVLDDVLEIDQAPRFLASALEIDLFENEGGPPLEPVMEMVAGVLQQSMSAGASVEGRPVGVIVNLEADGSRVALRPRRLQVVPTPDLVSRLGDIVGRADRVRIVP